MQVSSGDLSCPIYVAQGCRQKGERMLEAIQRLKIDVMTHGLAISEAAREEMRGSEPRPRPLTLADYASTSGVSMCLDGGIWINAPIADFNPNFVTEPAAELLWKAGRFLVRYESMEVGALPLPVPAYYDQLNAWGEKYTSYAITHTDRVRISPIQGCAITCQFCDLPYEYRYSTKRIEGLIESVARALDDPLLPAQHVLISGGTPRPEDYSYENEVYDRVCAAFPEVEVDVMMAPMPGLLNPERLKAAGVHGLSINLELYGEEQARKVMAGKAKITRQATLDFIEDAVNVFGPGRVRSLLMLGLEPLADTMRAVHRLAERGCDPVLSPFRPDPSTPLRSLNPPNADFLAAAYEGALHILAKYPETRLGPRCIPCQHNTLTFPDGTDAYFSSQAS
jgi:Radical SAM superfamily